MSRKLISAALMAAALAAPAHQARAQTATLCEARIQILAIYPSPTGTNSFDYFAVLKNLTTTAMLADIQFTGFPAGVTLARPVAQNVQIGANAQISNFRIGQGSTGAINLSTVTPAYDAATGSGPTMRITNCRFA